MSHSRLHQVASLLSTRILGAYQKAISHTHLQSYLEEFTFGFNCRTYKSHGIVFRRFLYILRKKEPVTNIGVTNGYELNPQKYQSQVMLADTQYILYVQNCS